MKHYLKILLVICAVQILTAKAAVSQADFDRTRDSLLQLIQETRDERDQCTYYEQLAQLYVYSQPALSLEYAQEALELAEKLDNYSMKAYAYRDFFNAHFYMGAPSDSLFRYARLAEKVLLENGDSSRLFDAYWMYAMYYGNLGHADEEIDYYLKALDISEQYLDDSEREAHLYNNIGSLLLEKNQFEEAGVYLQRALTLIKGEFWRAFILCNLADVYFYKNEKLDSVQLMYDEALEIYQAYSDTEGVVDANLGKARAFTKQGDIERAEQLFKECIQLSIGNNVGESLTNAYNSYAEFLYAQGRYKEASRYAQNGVDLAIERQNLYNIEEPYVILHQSLAKEGAYEKAYHAHLRWVVLKDSLNNEELLERINQLETAYQVEQKETQNKLLLAEKLADTRKIRNGNLLAVGLVLCLILAIGWGIAIHNANQKKKKYNEKLEATVAERTAELQAANTNLEQANYELRTFNYIASHDIKEPIRNIGNYAGLIQHKLPKAYQDSLGDYFEVIKNGTRQLYTLAEDFAEYTTMSRDVSVEMRTIDMDKMLNGILQNMKGTIIKYNGEVVNLGLPPLNVNQSLMYVALKNLIENGLKYNKSEIPKVTLSYQETPSHHEIIVADNGIGIEAAYFEKIFDMFTRLDNKEGHEGSGIGLAIVKLAMDKMKGKVRVESEIEEGSRFVLCWAV